jgi:hypothetical protein
LSCNNIGVEGDFCTSYSGNKYICTNGAWTKITNTFLETNTQTQTQQYVNTNTVAPIKTCTGQKDGYYCADSEHVIGCLNGAQVYSKDCSKVSDGTGAKYTGKCNEYGVMATVIPPQGLEDYALGAAGAAGHTSITGPTASCDRVDWVTSPDDSKVISDYVKSLTATDDNSGKSTKTGGTEDILPAKYPCSTTAQCKNYYQDCNYECVNGGCTTVESETAKCSGAIFVSYPTCEWNVAGCSVKTCPDHSTLTSSNQCQCDSGYESTGAACKIKGVTQSVTQIDWTTMGLLFLIVVILPLSYVGYTLKFGKKKKK